MSNNDTGATERPSQPKPVSSDATRVSRFRWIDGRCYRETRPIDEGWDTARLEFVATDDIRSPGEIIVGDAPAENDRAAVFAWMVRAGTFIRDVAESCEVLTSDADPDEVAELRAMVADIQAVAGHIVERCDQVKPGKGVA